MDQHGTGRVPTAGVRKDLLVAINTMPSALDMAFRTALLLTGDTRTAEAAVTDSIGACEDLLPGGLLIEAVRSAVRRRAKSSDGQYEVECLPTELRRLFKLLPLPRQCFVLRVLVGLSPEVCAELLEISIIEFEDAVYEALTQLPIPQFSKGANDPILTAVDNNCLLSGIEIGIYPSAALYVWLRCGRQYLHLSVRLFPITGHAPGITLLIPRDAPNTVERLTTLHKRAA